MLLTQEELEEFQVMWDRLGAAGAAEDDDANVRLQELQAKASRILTCCEAIQTCPIIYGRVSPEGTWEWRLNGAGEVYHRAVALRLDIPPPKFCPFCTTPLPEMERHNFEGYPVGNEADEYRCRTCDERFCRCLPPTVNWRPVPQEDNLAEHLKALGYEAVDTGEVHVEQDWTREVVFKDHLDAVLKYPEGPNAPADSPVGPSVGTYQGVLVLKPRS